MLICAIVQIRAMLRLRSLRQVARGCCGSKPDSGCGSNTSAAPPPPQEPEKEMEVVTSQNLEMEAVTKRNLEMEAATNHAKSMLP